MYKITKITALLLSMIMVLNNIYFPAAAYYQSNKIYSSSLTTENENVSDTYIGINNMSNTINDLENIKVEDNSINTMDSNISDQDNEITKKNINFAGSVTNTGVEDATTKELFIPYTLKIMNNYDYVGMSTTGPYTYQMSLKEMNEKYKKYGSLHTNGMPYAEYKEAMEYQWIDCTDYDGKVEKIKININNTIDYKKYVSILKKISRYDGVYLYKIGESYEGRDLYAIEIDIESDTPKNIYMLTGQVHAREFAGGTYILKMLVDLVQDAQVNEKTMNMLKKNKYVAVPVINVDGREALIYNPRKWTENGEMLKAYVNKTDGNRNFPGLMCGQLSKGNKLKWTVSKRPSLYNYPGDYVGSNPETKAIMKWLYHYIVVEQAKCLLDLHQQGSVIYAGKGWATNEQNKYSNDLRKKMFSHLNNGNKGRIYGKIQDEPKYGLEGTNSTITDYAISIACGAKFSPEHGFCVITDGKMDFILMQFNDLDNLKFKVNAPNISFATLTLEIGVGKSYLGNSIETRRLLANEYTKYHFDTMLYKLPDMIK